MITPDNIILTRTDIWEGALDKNDGPVGCTSFHHVVRHAVKHAKDRKHQLC